MRALGLDYGSARCGCAVSDPTGTIVTPIKAIDRPDTPTGMESLAAVARDYEVEQIIVGLPALSSGEEGAQARSARAFAGRLHAMTALPVDLFDERLTTRMAAATARRTEALASEDSMAAAHMLEGFLGSLQANDNAGDP